jgi:tRNA1Val (adenine37-N6)-methyltransferase
MKPSRPSDVELQPHECIDPFMDGKLKLIQSKDGYRFSADAVLLSDFVSIKPGDIVLDLGTGCGIMLLILLMKKPIRHALGLEIQEELAAQAARNALLNKLQDKITVIRGDIRRPPLTRASVDVVICNPPYRKINSGRINPDMRRAIARHEILSSIEDILRTSRDLLKRKGRLALIYPSVRFVDVLLRMRRFNLEPKRIRINYPSVTSDAKLVLIEAALWGRPGMILEPPIIGQAKNSLY